MDIHDVESHAVASDLNFLAVFEIPGIILIVKKSLESFFAHETKVLK